jgi:hypothetical protein
MFMSVAPDPSAWLERQKARLKANRNAEVLAALAPYREPEQVEGRDAPARSAHRYFSNRRNQLDYQGALQRG